MSRKYFIRIKKVSNDQNNLIKTAQTGHTPHTPPGLLGPTGQPISSVSVPAIPPGLFDEAKRVELMKILSDRLDKSVKLRIEILSGDFKFNPREHGWFMGSVAALGSIATGVLNKSNIPGANLALFHIGIAGAMLSLPNLAVDIKGSIWARTVGKINKQFHEKNIEVSKMKAVSSTDSSGNTTVSYVPDGEIRLSMHDIYEDFSRQGASVPREEGTWVVGGYKYFFKNDGDVDEIIKWCELVQKQFDLKNRSKIYAKLGGVGIYIIALLTYYSTQANNAKKEAIDFGQMPSTNSSSAAIEQSRQDAMTLALNARGSEIYNRAIKKLYGSRTPNSAQKVRDRQKIERIIDSLTPNLKLRNLAKSNI